MGELSGVAKGIKRIIRGVRENVSKDISDNTDQDSLYSRGLATEGYNGGYLHALDDITLALNGVCPNRERWWAQFRKNF